MDKPDEYLKYDLSVPKIDLKNDNDPGAKELVSDIKEKVFEMEDVDPDAFVSAAKSLEAEGVVFKKDSNGNIIPPKFELNLILKIKRKHLLMHEVKLVDKFNPDAAGEELINKVD